MNYKRNFTHSFNLKSTLFFLIIGITILTQSHNGLSKEKDKKEVKIQKQKQNQYQPKIQPHQIPNRKVANIPIQEENINDSLNKNIDQGKDPNRDPAFLNKKNKGNESADKVQYWQFSGEVERSLDDKDQDKIQ